MEIKRKTTTFLLFPDSLFPKAETNARCFLWRVKKKQLTGIVTSGVINVFEDTLLKERERTG